METLKLDLLGDEPDVTLPGVEFDDDSESEVKPLDLVVPSSEEGLKLVYQHNACPRRAVPRR
jgi:hypothetical protein